MFHVKQKLSNEDDIGGTGDKWRENLPEGVRDWSEVKESKSEDSFWDQMGNLRSMMGQSIRIPTDDASADDKAAFNERLMNKVPSLMQKPDIDDNDVMNAFYEQMGRPKESDAYEVPELKAPEGITLQEGLADNFKGIAHKHGLSQKQYEGVLTDYTQTTINQAEEDLSQLQTGMKGLHDEWGVTFDSNMDKAEAIRSKYFSDVIPNLDFAGADAIKAFSSIADKFGKEGAGNLIDEQRKEYSDKIAPAEAKERLNDILSNSEHAYWDAGDPSHKHAVDKVLSLTKAANPDMSTNADELR